MESFETAFGENVWLLGPSFSAADIEFGVLLHHLICLNLQTMFQTKPNILTFWAKFEARESVQGVLFPQVPDHDGVAFIEDVGSGRNQEDEFQHLNNSNEGIHRF